VFVGRHLVKAALAQGHNVTLFTRGLTNADLFPDAEHLRGDRTSDLTALEGRRFDAVVDTTGFDPEVVRSSSEVLRGNVGWYGFTSTISVYRNYGAPGIDETSPVARMDDTDLIGRRDTGAYGPRKARCEEIVLEYFPDALVVRCGLIIGPHDNVGRFTYWPRRVALGGEVLAPGAPDRPIQVIDVRDLTEWILFMSEQRAGGIFNATGVVSPFAELLDEALRITTSDARITWVPDDFLVAHDVRAQTELPLWTPQRPGEGGHYGISNDKARAHGISFRPLAESIGDTLAWLGNAPAHSVGAGGSVGLSPEREQSLLSEWHRTTTA
jgi:2'-hydroxyisoflavone reductase